MLSFNQTAIVSGSPNSQVNASALEGEVFSANLRMIMLDGSSPDTHLITNFRLSNISSIDNGTMTYTGSSTVSMPDTPIVEVPTTIEVSGEIISIFPDPSSVDGHFGDTLKYAAISIGRDNDDRGPSPYRTGEQQ